MNVDSDQGVKHLGSALRNQRSNRGLTAAQVALALDVRESTVLRWETGATCPTPRHLTELVELGVLTTHDICQTRPEPHTLRDLRFIAMLDLAGAAELAGLSPSALLRVERGVSAVGERIDGFARAYGVEPHVVLAAAQHTKTQGAADLRNRLPTQTVRVPPSVSV